MRTKEKKMSEHQCTAPELAEEVARLRVELAALVDRVSVHDDPASPKQQRERAQMKADSEAWYAKEKAKEEAGLREAIERERLERERYMNDESVPKWPVYLRHSKSSSGPGANDQNLR